MSDSDEYTDMTETVKKTTQKTEQKMEQKTEKHDNKLTKQMAKDIRIFFSNERVSGIILRDFRQQLERAITNMYRDKKISEIPDEFSVKLKYNVEYKVFFLNKDFLIEEFGPFIFESKCLRWFTEDQDF